MTYWIDFNTVAILILPFPQTPCPVFSPTQENSVSPTTHTHTHSHTHSQESWYVWIDWTTGKSMGYDGSGQSHHVMRRWWERPTAWISTVYCQHLYPMQVVQSSQYKITPVETHTFPTMIQIKIPTNSDCIRVPVPSWKSTGIEFHSLPQFHKVLHPLPSHPRQDYQSQVHTLVEKRTNTDFRK